jgi:hypothetical protein
VTVTVDGNVISLDEPGPTAIGDALFVQRELTGDLLDFYDSYVPESWSAAASAPPSGSDLPHSQCDGDDASSVHTRVA